jgi:hypothetical protein
MHQVLVFLCVVCRFGGRELLSVFEEYGLAVENGFWLSSSFSALSAGCAVFARVASVSDSAVERLETIEPPISQLH